MSTLLLHLEGSPTFNRTIFTPNLFIYDDLIIYRKRSWFVLREITISYHQISQVSFTKGLFFGHLEIITGEETLKIRYLPKSKTRSAKDIIDQKIYHSHAKHSPALDHNTSEVTTYEKSLNRLQELLNRGSISKKEFEKKKAELFKELR